MEDVFDAELDGAKVKTDPEANPEANPEPRSTSNRKTKTTPKRSQPSIKDMFSTVSSAKIEKRKNSNEKDSPSESRPDKRLKTEAADDSEHAKPAVKAPDVSANAATARTAAEPQPRAKKIDKVPPKRCTECRQIVDGENPQLRMMENEPAEGVDEVVALTDERLELEGLECDERMTFLMTAYSVFDKNNHLVDFSAGLVERNVEIFVNGIVKPAFAENPASAEGGVPVVRVGPVNEWWITGFDRNSKVTVGLTTMYGDYYLQEPHEEYSPLIFTLSEKIFLSKYTIEFLVENDAATYEDLLDFIQTIAPPEGVKPFTEDVILRHAQFIVDQIASYDAAVEEDDDDPLLAVPCVKTLITLAGIKLSKRKKLVMDIKAPKQKDHTTTMRATTTPLVHEVFDRIFGHILEGGKAPSKRNRARRCNTCDACNAPDCGDCASCKDMRKFGGTGRMKQCCVIRRCPNAVVSGLDDGALSEEEDSEEVLLPTRTPTPTTPEKKRRRGSGQKVAEFIGAPLAEEKRRKDYLSCRIGDAKFQVGDFVKVVNPDENASKNAIVVKIVALFEEDGEQMMHGETFIYSEETILGCVTGDEADREGKDASLKNELFASDECDDYPMCDILKKISVLRKTMSESWFDEGGIAAPAPLDTDYQYFYEKWYDRETARFEDLPVKSLASPPFCRCCDKSKENRLMSTPRPSSPIKDDQNALNPHFKSFDFLGKTFRLGDSVFLLPSAFSFDAKPAPTPKPSAPKIDVLDDPKTYPEAYRKSSHVKGSNLTCPEPYRIARIISIFRKGSNSVKVKVGKFYRPENTHRGIVASYEANCNLLYWSEETVTIEAEDVVDKCHVKYVADLDSFNVDDWFLKTKDAFYFTSVYNAATKEMEPLKRLPSNLESKGGKGGKVKGKGKVSVSDEPSDIRVREDPTIPSMPDRPLKCLDIFSGCGGLSEGLHQAGVAESWWAIEKVESAAKAYKRNNPRCIVFDEDCNLLLKIVMEGETRYNRQNLPLKGQVELLCGGPPCQGFSGMNRFNSREYSAFKNSLVVTYLSYCDYYRPKFFILENVRNFVSFKGGMVLKLALRCLVSMGYQCTFGVLQAGTYGVSQTRRRAILLAAAPGEVLPVYPEPTHTFSPQGLSLSVTIDNRRYETTLKRLQSAPYRTVTVRDAMRDLPEICNGAKKELMDYGTEPISHFQRLIRRGTEGRLYDHICKEMSPLVEARIRYIPLAPGSDWRDLPNITMTLSDGSKCLVLRYTHKDAKNGKGPDGALRGVCSCAEGANKKCSPEFRQNNTLIPWCLPHTGNRHNQWAGLYGRVEWDGFFSTTITNPEPMGKQGRVLHPDQTRVVSVRECARSQGFPDTYKFFGNVLDKHRQVGNAVPPPMARAIGLEIRRAICEKARRNGFVDSVVENKTAAPKFEKVDNEKTEVLREIGNRSVGACSS